MEGEASSDNYVKAGEKGGICLKVAGSWVDLLIAMRYFWEEKNGSHFEDLFTPCMREIAPHGDMLYLARSVAQAGIDACSTLRNSPIGSITNQLSNIWTKYWPYHGKTHAKGVSSTKLAIPSPY